MEKKTRNHKPAHPEKTADFIASGKISSIVETISGEKRQTCTWKV
ncbi:MAG: hypothetical protein PHF18_04855 [Methanosarcina sp.]|nr:hypothetical protein [Methanosarcina sp.]MDD3246171.1 hypothetical protein [Methanosarcina sp.]MDD4248427.1 hypothetical protein [Methanosarcina sp.]